MTLFVYLNIAASPPVEILAVTHTTYERPGLILFPEDAMNSKSQILKAMLNTDYMLMKSFSYFSARSAIFIPILKMGELS